MLMRAWVAIVFVLACRDASDPGFEIVRVPQSAYLAADASAKPDAPAAPDASRDLIIVCIPKPQPDDEDADAPEDCPDRYDNRTYDEKATDRHRKNDGEENVCCYRKGRVSRSATEEVE